MANSNLELLTDAAKLLEPLLGELVFVDALLSWVRKLDSVFHQCCCHIPPECPRWVALEAGSARAFDRSRTTNGLRRAKQRSLVVLLTYR